MAIIADTAPFFHRFFFAAQYAGFIPVPLPAAIQMGGGEAYVAQIRRMMESCGAAVAVAPDGYLDLLNRAARPLSLVLAGSAGDFDALPQAEELPQPLAGDEPAYLQYTSGSTRFPRGVEMSQQAVLSNLREIADIGAKFREDDRLVSWLPFLPRYGFGGFCSGSADARLVGRLPQPANIRHAPAPLVEADLGTTGARFSSCPPSGYGLCATRLRLADQDKYDLSSWRLAGVGAERIDPRLLERFSQLLAPAGFDPKAFVGLLRHGRVWSCISFAPLDQALTSTRWTRTW